MTVQPVIGVLGSNTYVVTKSDTTLIIDAGAPLKAVQKALGDNSPSGIILTHEHYDHVFHVASYVKKFQCPVYCHPTLIQDFRDGNYTRILGEVELPDPNNQYIPIENENDFNIGEFQITPIVSQGHSTCSIVFKIDNNLFTGDVLFRNTIGRMDLMENGEVLMKKTLAKLANVQFETAYHGHAGNSTYQHQQQNIRHYLESL